MIPWRGATVKFLMEFVQLGAPGFFASNSVP
jgi:hypothetical protein